MVSAIVQLKKSTPFSYNSTDAKKRDKYVQLIRNTFDKEYDYGKTGWMSERFCFCEGLLTEKWPDGSPASTWFALMPWASASIIEGLVPVME